MLSSRSKNALSSEKRQLNNVKGETKPSDETLKINHQSFQKEIKAAIINVQTDHPNALSFEEFYHCLVNLKYLQSLKDSQANLDKNLHSQVYQDIELAEHLLNQLWSYLNPLGNETVSKATVFDFLLLLMFNIGHQYEKKLA